jgi:hypothetical protein
MKCLVELINELKGMDEPEIARRFRLPNTEVTYYRRLDFDNWMRRCLRPGQQFASLDEAWAAYERSFG